MTTDPWRARVRPDRLITRSSVTVAPSRCSHATDESAGGGTGDLHLTRFRSASLPVSRNDLIAAAGAVVSLLAPVVTVAS